MAYLVVFFIYVYVLFQAYLSELFGIAPGWQIQRDCAVLLLKLRSKEINARLTVGCV